ncbi:hypothetical protein [Bradyrhizobium sp. sBnM-33]|uniref:hypothetical protein n=1 Tax=Bradyrhizobium sp. sBnM-33 TaxID=2831780 RepID=UPI001BD0392A|nr:hypothetical protein [Bradyrhizobium sp. sBnM-33]WOH47177.1 hypothetical protein RX328_23545 [Bradyrhizobium sp. sBnM-33]
MDSQWVVVDLTVDAGARNAAPTLIGCHNRSKAAAAISKALEGLGALGGSREAAE